MSEINVAADGAVKDWRLFFKDADLQTEVFAKLNDFAGRFLQSSAVAAIAFFLFRVGGPEWYIQYPLDALGVVVFVLALAVGVSAIESLKRLLLNLLGVRGGEENVWALKTTWGSIIITIMGTLVCLASGFATYHVLE